MSERPGTFRSLAILFHYRARLGQSLLQEIRQRYAGSVLGLAWAVVYPLMMLTLYAVLYAVVFKVRPASLDSRAYVVLVFSGLVPLLAFNESMMTSASSLVANRALLLNTVFPAELIPMRAVLAAQVPSVSAMTATLIAGFWLGRTDWQAPLVVPFLWLLLVMFSLGLAWILSLLTLVVRDIQQILGLVLMALTILSPFAYTPDMVPAGLRGLLYLNPLSPYVLGFQQAITYGRWPDVSVMVPAVGLSMISFFGGFWFFRRAKFVFFDYA